MSKKEKKKKKKINMAYDRNAGLNTHKHTHSQEKKTEWAGREGGTKGEESAVMQKMTTHAHTHT